jgi:hypothetical protein
MDRPTGPESVKFLRQYVWIDFGKPVWERNFDNIKDSGLAVFGDVLWHYCCLIDVLSQNEIRDLYDSENLKMFRDCKAFEKALKKALSNELQMV